MKYWEIIADNLSKAGWSWGCVSAWIPTGEQSGLLTHIAMAESVWLRTRVPESADPLEEGLSAAATLSH